MGTICPEGPINWGPIVGDQMFGDHMRLGPNVSQPGVGGNKSMTKRDKKVVRWEREGQNNCEKQLSVMK